MRTTGKRAAGVVLALAVLAGCGGRVSAGEVLAGAGGGPVTIELPPGTLPQRAVPGAERTVQAPPDTAAAAPAQRAERATTANASARPRRARPPDDPTRTAAIPRAAAAPAACPPSLPPLRIGQVGHFSGVLGPLTAPARTGLAVWAKAVNASGGLACRQVEVYSSDDGADPARTASAISDLVANKHVVALAGVFSVLTPAALKTSAERFKLPVVGGDVLAYEWHQSPYLFPQGASIRMQAYGLARQVVLEGKPKAGLMYCVETPTCTSLAKDIEGDLGKRAGIQIVYSSPVTIVATDYTAQCQNAKNAGAQVLGLAMDGASMSRVVRSCAALGYTPPIVTGALGLGPTAAADAGIRRNTVLTETMNAPWMLADSPGQRAYQAAMKRYAPGVELSAASIMTWSAGRLFDAATRRLPAGARTRTIGSVELYAALGRIANDTLDGLAPPLTFASGRPAPDAKCVFYLRLDEGGWSATRGGTFLCP